MNSEFLSVPPLLVTIGLIVVTSIANISLGFGFLLTYRWKKYALSTCFYTIAIICSIYDFILCYWITHLIGFVAWIPVAIIFGFALPFGGSIFAMKITCSYWKQEVDKINGIDIELQSFKN